ncbi:zinc finger MYM-type protein 1-like [Hordeum vulgare subsp. vulgare]|uniref:zinc finger MYM-type protein 1-like n=1 Tax=Hordeum vulgare subsp. vulgare TaxID=112509 RepID=UPI001D1A5AAE|nr:zinc finger MYM-type protein 1-like [Hordeum vulgare subsp. vulgare]
MTSGIIQKALAKHCAMAITKAIKEEMDGCLFSVLIDECRDISVKEQMAVVVRFLSKKGETMERFLGIKHVPDTTSASLKKALLEVFAKHGLLVARLRGQGYDGASNMRGEFNGLQKLIRDENPHAFYIHCFAHQLQLIVVAVSRCCKGVEDFFDYVTMIVNLSSSSCRRKDMLLDKQKEVLLAKIEGGEVPTGRGKNQETSLVRPGDTRWGSHYRTLSRIESMWDAVIEVLGIVEDDVRVPCRAGGLVHQMETFSFVFILKMMLKLLRMTNDLSLLLQKKDQNVVQAMSLVMDVRTRLINWRNDGWEPLLEDVKAFCIKNDIPIPNMDDMFTKWGKSRKGGRNNVTADHFFRVDTFYVAIDSITTEFDHRFNEVSSELLQNFSCLDPRNSFSRFNVVKLAQLTEIYHADFSNYEREHIEDNLELFIIHMRRVEDFRACHDIASLAKKMVELERHIMFPTVYRLIELALLLPVATATVERAFSAMKIIKTELRNKMSGCWLNDLMPSTFTNATLSHSSVVIYRDETELKTSLDKRQDSAGKAQEDQPK